MSCRCLSPIELITQDKCQVDLPQKECYRSLHSEICSDLLQIDAAFGVFLHPLDGKTDLFLHERMKLRSHLPKDSRCLGILVNLILFGPL